MHPNEHFNIHKASSARLQPWDQLKFRWQQQTGVIFLKYFMMHIKMGNCCKSAQMALVRAARRSKHWWQVVKHPLVLLLLLFALLLLLLLLPGNRANKFLHSFWPAECALDEVETCKQSNNSHSHSNSNWMAWMPMNDYEYERQMKRKSREKQEGKG